MKRNDTICVETVQYNMKRYDDKLNDHQIVPKFFREINALYNQTLLEKIIETVKNYSPNKTEVIYSTFYKGRETESLKQIMVK